MSNTVATGTASGCPHSPRPLQDGSWTCDWCFKDMTPEMRQRSIDGEQKTQVVKRESALPSVAQDSASQDEARTETTEEKIRTLAHVLFPTGPSGPAVIQYASDRLAEVERERADALVKLAAAEQRLAQVEEVANGRIAELEAENVECEKLVNELNSATRKLRSKNEKLMAIADAAKVLVDTDFAADTAPLINLLHDYTHSVLAETPAGGKEKSE